MIESWVPPAIMHSAVAISIDTLAVIACVALTAATLIFVFMIQPDPADSAPHRSHLDQLMERRSEEHTSELQSR